MGLTGLVLGIAVIAIALVILVPFFNDSFASVTEQFYQKVESDTIGKKAVAGDTVCDLKITFYGELDFANQDGRTTLIANPFETNLVVFMNEKTDHPEIAQYEWKNCYVKGGSAFASLLGGVTGLELLGDYANQKTVKLDVSGIALGDSFSLKIEGEDNNGNLLRDSFGNTVWEKKVVIDDWSQIKIPYAFQVRYKLNDVVYDNYELSVNAIGKSINNNPSNQPLIYNVVK